MPKKQERKETLDAEAYQIKVNYALDLLEKRISQHRKMLEKIDQIIKEAVSRRDKATLVEALRAKRQVEKALRKYMGYYRTLSTLAQQIQEVALIKAIASTIVEGKEIIKREAATLSPEAVEAAMAETEEIIGSVEEVSDILSQGFILEEDEDVEEEAEKLLSQGIGERVAEEKAGGEKADLLRRLHKVLESGEEE